MWQKLHAMLCRLVHFLGNPGERQSDHHIHHKGKGPLHPQSRAVFRALRGKMTDVALQRLPRRTKHEVLQQNTGMVLSSTIIDTVSSRPCWPLTCIAILPHTIYHRWDTAWRPDSR